MNHDSAPNVYKQGPAKFWSECGKIPNITKDGRLSQEEHVCVLRKHIYKANNTNVYGR